MAESDLTSSDLAKLRQDYQAGALIESEAAEDAIEQFARWFTDAGKASKAGLVREVNAMTLATADRSGKPSARIVLLKGFDQNGFVFYTNYLSHKGTDLAENPRATIVFFWENLERQIRIDGTVEKVTRKETKEYFHSRPVNSQIGACVSAQSEVIGSREMLEEKAAELAKQFAGQEIPVPEHWGGYRLIPNEIEFWQGRPSRLHDRLRYTKWGNGWKIDRLSP